MIQRIDVKIYIFILMNFLSDALRTYSLHFQSVNLHRVKMCQNCAIINLVVLSVQLTVE